MKSVMTHQFSQVPKADIPRSSFDRSHGLKTTFDGGKLVPIFLDEALPGDTFNLKMTGFSRLSTPIFPIMDNMYMETFFFSVPMRLVWDNWQKFNGEQLDPGDSTDYTVPVNVSNVVSGQLGDYFGLPPNTGAVPYSNLPFRAYWLIFDEWFRDQNLQNSADIIKTDVAQVINNTTDYTWNVLQDRGKRHDYFTSALPWPQKGDAVSIPLGTTADIHTAQTDGLVLSVYSDANSQWQAMGAATANLNIAAGASSESYKLYADLSNATASTINQLRQAFQIQKLLERDARGGTRYIEVIKAHFGVTSPDARLQRPEFLGGGSSPVNINSVPQTSSTDVTSPQGNLSAFGTATLNNHGFTKSFTEHSLIIGLVNVRADLTYQQGLNRLWSRATRYDFYWPALATIGEQTVLNKEIYADGSANDDLVFGYQERYAEYRYKPSQITGKMRSAAPGTLDAWHLSQDFSALPVLNTAFIIDAPPIDRVVAVPSEPHFIFDAHFSLRCARPMPLYGVPGMIDHF